MTPEEFQQSFMPYAQGVSQRTGLDPRMVLAQAALETGWGRSAPNNNFFGIKSHGQSGGSNLMTQEFQDGRMVSMPQSFRGYESPEQSFQGYADFILNNPRYGDVMAQGDLAGQIGAMGQSGYATDPDYASKLASIARRFGGDIPAGQQPTISTRNAADTPQAIGRDTRSALGLLQNEGNEMAQPQQPQRPQGLLSSLGVQRRDPNAQGETSQPFYNRQSFGDTMARLAPALGRMGVMGLEGPAQAALDARNQRQGDERAQQAQAAQRNQTIEWLVSNGREDLAGAVQSGGLPIGEAMSLAMAPAEAPPEQFRQVTGAELGMEGESAGMMFNVGPDGKITAIGGSGVNVDITNDMGGGEIDPDAALRAGLSEGLVKEFGTYRTAGSAASASLGDLNTLQELAALAPEGPISGRLAQAFPEFNDVAALRDAIVKRVGPSLRAEGSGSTSDIEYQGMLDSLGNMRNTREANAAIIAVMQAKAQFNIARADIVNRMMGDTNYTQAQAMQDLTALDQSSGIPDQVRSLISSYGNGGATPPAGGGGLSPEADAFMRGN
jgi:hypothetical protein